MKILFTLIFLPLLSHASDRNLSCSVSLNLEKVLETQVALPEKASNYQFASLNDFRFFLTDTGSKIELQIFNPEDPSRSYAIADLKQTRDIELTLWKREYLLSTKCSVLP